VKDPESLRILVAEDNGVYRKLLCAMIERLTGTHPASVADGAEACEAVEKDCYDVVLIDNHMPVMNGIDATRNIRSQSVSKQQPYIVAVSGSSDHQDLRRFEAAGTDAMLSKPFGLSELSEVIQDAASAVLA
jgi:CheY-like chemotaxis protein